MKKFKLLLILFISIFIFNTKVHAGANLSVSTSSVTVGKKFTVYVNMTKAAAWNIHVNATGPVSGCSIHQADATDDALDTSKKFSTTCTATGVGEIKLTLSGDVTSASDGNAVNISGTKIVTVTEASSNNNNNNKPNTNNNLSKNNNLKTLTVDGYELVKVDNKNYTLSVSNNVTSIKVNATAEDTKAKVSGIGKHDLKVGDNNIEVVITSESGAKNIIKIKVTRKDGYYLEDLESLLSSEKENEINVTVKSDSKVTTEILNKIKNSGKKVNLNYYDENKKLIYSWELDGKNIKDIKEFASSISYTTENYKEIGKLSNYADGLYINFNHNGDLPSGTKIKIYVGDKFDNGSLVNIYHYDGSKKTLDFIKDGLTVNGGYVEFDIEHCSEYFVTMSTIGSSNDVKTSSPLFIVISIVEFIVIVGLVGLYFLKIKNSNKEEITYIR